MQIVPKLRGARLSGNSGASIGGTFSFRCVSIFSMTTGSSILAMTLTLPPQCRQDSRSVLKAHFIESRR